MAFKKFELTNSGINLLAQVQANQGSLNFTKIKIGSGTYTGDIKLLTDVITEFHNFPVTSTQVQADKSVKIQAPFDNSTFSQAYSWREIGIFAKLGNAGTEVLYSYSSDDTPDTIPDYDGGNNKYRRTLDIRNYISDVANVTLTITNVTDKYDFNTHAEMKTATYLTDGDRINLWGKTSQNDGIVEKRVVKVANGKDGVLLDNGLYANLLDFDFREEINLNVGGQKENYENMQDVPLVVDGVYIDSNTGIKYKCHTTTPALPSPNPDYVTEITNKNLQKQIEILSKKITYDDTFEVGQDLFVFASNLENGVHLFSVDDRVNGNPNMPTGITGSAGLMRITKQQDLVIDIEIFTDENDVFKILKHTNWLQWRKI